MRTVIQRVKKSSVTVNDTVTGKTGPGLAILVGFGQNDKPESFKSVVEKIINMRIFSNEKGRFHYSVLDLKGEILLVPQFTLFADTSQGRRPEFFSAMEPETAALYFEKFTEVFREVSGLKVECGVFGADMLFELINDGPVTIVYDSENNQPTAL